MSLSLKSQKFVETRPRSSAVPSKPEKIKNDPLPCFIMLSLSWISMKWNLYKQLKTSLQPTFNLGWSSSSAYWPCLTWISRGRSFWKVVKTPQFETTTGAWTSTSSWPFFTFTPNTHTPNIKSWPSLNENNLVSLLTIGCSIFINQDLRDRSSDQTAPSIFLNSSDDVEGDLTGSTFWVVSASFVMMHEESVDQNAGFLWRHT